MIRATYPPDFPPEQLLRTAADSREAAKVLPDWLAIPVLLNAERLEERYEALTKERKPLGV